MNIDLLNRLKKNSVLEYTTTLAKSSLFFEKESTQVEVPIINLAFSGHFNKGFIAGLTMIAGPSKHFKSNIGLLLVKAYLNKYKDAICIYYDSEFGCTPEYIQAAGLDPERIIHIPVMDIEQLTFDIMAQVEEIKKTDKVIIFIDSVGNLASKKEVEDAKKQSGAQDMSRAKKLKGLWRMVTPYLTMKNIPCVAINHVYSSQDLFPKDIMSGGTGGMLSANTVFFVGKAQEKEDGELAGYKFTINIEKSRFVKEKSKFPFIVTYERGINIWSGLLDLALETGHVIKPKNGWYTRPSIEGDKSWRAGDSNCSAFWKPIFENTDFKEACAKKYALGQTSLIEDEKVTDIDIDALDTEV